MINKYASTSYSNTLISNFNISFRQLSVLKNRSNLCTRTFFLVLSIYIFYESNSSVITFLFKFILIKYHIAKL